MLLRKLKWLFKLSLFIHLTAILFSCPSLIAQDKKFILQESNHFTTPCLINDILFDSHKNIWLAMENGLLRLSKYDSIDHTKSKLFRTDNSKLRQNHINCLWTDGDNNIWGGTYSKGLILFDSTGKFHHFPFANAKILLITSITQTREERILVATQTDGIYALSGESLKPLFNNRNSKLISNRINFISIDSSRLLWCGTEKGISIYNYNTQKWKSYPKLGNVQSVQKLKSSCFASAITSNGPIFWRKQLGKWIKVEKGIFKFDFRLKEIVKGNRLFWINSDKGLIQFNGTKTSLFNQKQGLPEGSITNIGIAPDSSLWISHTSGLYKWDKFIQAKNIPPTVSENGIAENILLKLKLIQFTQSEANFTDSSASDELHAISEYLKKYPTRNIEIHGHTDNRGNQRANWNLSKQRVLKIAEILITLGVRESQIRTIWHGETNPLLPNTSESNRQQNRRVEVRITN